jgi:3-oxoacyl-[acyl-carrier protein] reductase
MGQQGLIRSLAKEFGSDGIRVNGVSPGLVDTERAMSNYPDDFVERTTKSTPLGRVGTPQEVADACCFLSSDKASFITGQILHVNGGLYPTPIVGEPC